MSLNFYDAGFGAPVIYTGQNFMINHLKVVVYYIAPYSNLFDRFVGREVSMFDFHLRGFGFNFLLV